jgi:hypothetical protein
MIQIFAFLLLAEGLAVLRIGILASAGMRKAFRQTGTRVPV